MSGGASWQDCRRVLDRVLGALDWRLLGQVYCNSGGEEFWRDRRGPVVELGLCWARGLLQRVSGDGRSLYAGAGVAELPAMIAEVVVRGRGITACNLRARECDALNRGLRAAGLADRLTVVCADAAEVAAEAACDHLAAVSLFTDPETFPLCSAVGYGRLSPVQLDVVAFAEERERARALAARLWSALRMPGWITTTAEEVAWFLEQADAAGVRLDADDELVDTAVVGDPIGFLRVG